MDHHIAFPELLGIRREEIAASKRRFRQGRPSRSVALIGRLAARGRSMSEALERWAAGPATVDTREEHEHAGSTAGRVLS